jgi:hypothetical protein
MVNNSIYIIALDVDFFYSNNFEIEVIEGNKVTIKRVVLLHDKSIYELFILLTYLEEKYIYV